MTQPQSPAARSPNGVWSAVFACALTGIAAPVLYYAIYRFTHHRPLGAATLSIACLVAFGAALAFSWRIGVGRKVALAAVSVTGLGLAVLALFG